MDFEPREFMDDVDREFEIEYTETVEVTNDPHITLTAVVPADKRDDVILTGTAQILKLGKELGIPARINVEVLH